MTALTYIRSEIRRVRREQEAHMQIALNEIDSEAWPQIAPLLDDAMAKLSAADRHAIVLRYFDGKSLGEVGAALGASEGAAKKRVTRAVEKLRGWFTKRGVTLTATVLTAAISANSVQAAPPGLAATVMATAVNRAVVSGSTLTFIKGALKVMAWTKAKTVIALGVSVFLAAGTATIVQIRKYYDPETYLSASDWRLEKFKKAPPLVLLQPTRHPQPAHLLDADGNSYVNFRLDAGSGKFGGRHCWLKLVIATAYDVPVDQIAFPSDAALTNDYYDFLVTTPTSPREKLQEEIRRVTGYSAKMETSPDGEKLVVSN